jgi:hypothetical protein
MRMYFAEKNPVWKLCLSTLYRLKLSPMPLHPVPDPIVISVEKKMILVFCSHLLQKLEGWFE